MSYTAWLDKMNMVSDSELRERLFRDCYGKGFAEKRVQENHDMYEEFCEKNNLTPNYN
ncbi:hypothetical protein QCM8_283 [Bacillus phage QCM8]|nr:hypothetical protein QCM8_7 [Bacillus phage QCM8]AOZ62201.1 hypothetical protein QCM8_283 [Bacillus phage QCM8]